MSNKIQLLIVDDSIMDRMVLRNILEKDYDIVEAQNGYGALEIIRNNSNIKGMLLDISMPVLDGFGVLSNLNRKVLERIPTLLISSEATKEIILKAANFGVAGFIKKPFNSTMILAKLKSLYGQNENFLEMQMRNSITEVELQETLLYIEKLRRVYLTYLKSEEKEDFLYRHVSEIMHIIISEYYMTKNPHDLTPERIEIISQAAYFYDIGKIIIRNERAPKKYSQGNMEETIPETHTIAGADLISTNTSPRVSYFVKIASDFCMHHHERYDGQGYPHGLRSSINNIYTQFLSMTIEFAKNFFTHGRIDVDVFDMAASFVFNNKEAYKPECIEILELSQDEIISYYQKNPQKRK